jgi:UDP-N-acetyl-2-amino-2-deoxyglucuronate dehydrogenase
MKTIALIGCGRISKRHIEAIEETEGVEVAVVCDIIEKRAQETAELLQVPYETDYRNLRDVDIAAVLTPSGMHPCHAAEIAECTNIEHILIEKPISLTLREAYELFERVDAAGKKLLPVYQNRYNPLVAFVKELLDSGKLGNIYQFVSNVFWSRNKQYFEIDWHGTQALDGGVLYTQASHYVDMVHYFFGDMVESKGIGGNLRNLEVHDTASAVCKFSSGTVGSINATVGTYEKNYLTEFTIIAQRGTIRLSGTNLNTIDFWNVEGMDKPDMDFTLDHVYGKGHNTMYEYIASQMWDKFPTRDDVISGIRMMEQLSF